MRKSVLLFVLIGWFCCFRAEELFLSQNMPNPFDGVTDFILTLPYEDNIVVEVFDMTGRRVTHKSLRLHMLMSS
ncbi:MAG: T9SS type A sorting domain-containing protein [Bacteroidales bacterium]|nr:T9SS type A sorting domain-containing protein [Bacteroidales bacterium]